MALGRDMGGKRLGQCRHRAVAEGDVQDRVGDQLDRLNSWVAGQVLVARFAERI